MPYIAMARKWRPRSFSEMVGQEHIAQTLKNAITTGNIHHAFLFSGTRGVGKTTSARILAAMLNCTAASEQKPCGQCESCKAITAGLSMDVMEMDAASNNGVDDMREVLENTQYPPMNSKYRVLIIDEVHALSKPAWYSMLKTLEEPPSYLVFIFATTDPNKIPATILSRVLCFDFKRLSSLQISKRLAFICEQEGIKVAPEALSIISEKADGSMRDALTIFDEVFAYSGNSITAESAQKALGIPPDALYVELIKAFEAHDAKGSFAILEKATLAGAEVQVFLDGFIRFLRNFLYARLGISAEQLEISPESLDSLKKLAPELEQGDILRISKMIMELSEKCSAKHGLNPRLIAEAEFSKIAWLDRVVNINEALKNISNVPLNKENQKKIGGFASTSGGTSSPSSSSGTNASTSIGTSSASSVRLNI
ncbi:MAG: DNA polymerase III subunit gamma/tau [Fibromonadaceae bacterium]|jgi:DNA polymerase-3 subunit gamma/tau|nr:DNA polymerase III subunit gamma/tau [Fibromonadaceae bacterium]